MRKNMTAGTTCMMMEMYMCMCAMCTLCDADFPKCFLSAKERPGVTGR